MKRSVQITWDQLRVGLMIVVALAIMVIAIYKVGTAANLFSKRYELVTFFADANGLRKGGQVMIAGQLAGVVHDIEFLPVDFDTTRNLRVTMRIDGNVRDQVRSDSKARLRTLGLLGDKVVDISPGTPRFAVLTPGDTVESIRALDYEAVIAQAAEAVDDMVLLVRDLRQITGGIVRGEGSIGQLMTNRSLYDQLTGTLSRTNATLARLQSSNGTLGRLLDDPTMYNRLVAVLGSTDSLVRALNTREGTLGKLLHDDSLYVNLVGITEEGRRLMQEIARGEGTINKLLTDDTLYDQLNKLTTDMAAILADVRRDPRAYTRGLVEFRLFGGGRR
jgi:phospholipid/cholesterol/gamma-HCH transport system substrate-binding protein